MASLMAMPEGSVMAPLIAANETWPNARPGSTPHTVTDPQEHRRPGQHDHANVVGVACLVNRVDQLITRLTAKGIHFFGPVDGDPRRAVAYFIQNIFVVHVPILWLN